jgi:hypothetical protein
MRAHLSKPLLSLALAAALLLWLSTQSGCGSSSAGPADSGPPDLDAGGCYASPSSSFEITNGCTDAGFLDKHPALPLLLSDGGLPPLP